MLHTSAEQRRECERAELHLTKGKRCLVEVYGKKKQSDCLYCLTRQKLAEVLIVVESRVQAPRGIFCLASLILKSTFILFAPKLLFI